MAAAAANAFIDDGLNLRLVNFVRCTMKTTSPRLAVRATATRVLETRLQNADELPTLPVFLSIADLVTLTGMSAPTLRRMELAGEFPRRVNIGERRKGLPLRAYAEWAVDRCVAMATAEEASKAAGKGTTEEAA